MLLVGRWIVIFLTGYQPFFHIKTERVSVVYSDCLNIHIICAGGD